MISVIIPAYHSISTLPACLNALAHQTHPPDEVIVVDDGSTDGTVDLARKAGVKVILQEHKGPAAARNLGAGQASGDLILFTDSDCEPDSDWVARMTAPFSDPLVMGVKGTYRTRQAGVVPRFVQQEYESKYIRMAKQPKIDFIDTYSAAYRRDIFLINDGFDPAFPVPSVEDQEFSFRLARKGYCLVFAAQASVYHQHDLNLGEYLRRKFGIGYWKAFMLRWLPEKAFTDSHTLPSQRWQILILGLAFLATVLSFVWPLLLWLVFACLLFFYASGIPFLIEVWQKDPHILWAAPGLLLCRAISQGLGLTSGFIFPPKTHRRASVGLTLSQRVLKRIVDIVGALVGLVVSFPVILAAALAIKITSPGPIFFFQQRCGENGHQFRIIKLRTMVNGAEQQLQNVLTKEQLGNLVFKIPHDPRVTPVGRILRRWSLDELPQLWNVLSGEMSLVGPRPEEAWVVAQYNDKQRQRLLIKPGLTGPMQVNGRGDLDMDTRLQLEMEYIQNYSFWKDLVIIVNTIPAVLFGYGAY